MHLAPLASHEEPDAFAGEKKASMTAPSGPLNILKVKLASMRNYTPLDSLCLPITARMFMQQA